MRLLIFILILPICVFAQHNQHTDAKPDTIKGSPHKSVSNQIGKLVIQIEYNSPAVRKRIIWGGLVAYDEVWVTGAHNATSISFSEDVLIDGKKVSKGKYAFFTIPSTKEWTLILNKNWEQHLADEYDSKNDVLRLKQIPISNEHTERLVYTIQGKDEKTALVEMAWEKLKINFEIILVK
jgi:hypothetical protein